VRSLKSRIILFAFPILLAASPANGQVLIALLFGDVLNTGKVEFGLDGGLNWSQLHGIDQAKDLRLWNLGFYFDIKLPDSAWMIHTGVIVKSTMGTDNSPVYSLGDVTLDAAFIGGRVATRLNYFNVPIMLKHRFSNNISLEGGVMLGLLYGATDEFIKTVQDEDDLRYERNVRSSYHPLDAGFMAGAGYRLYGLNLGVRYYYGLVDVYIDDATSGRFNRSFYITVGIPIGAGSAQ
jgi:hypothetical protein